MFDRKEYRRQYREQHREQEMIKQKEYYQNHKPELKKKQNILHKTKYKNLEWRKIVLERNKMWRDKLKLEILIHYGGNPPKCACLECYYHAHDSPIEFLTIDHINNDGAKHRREIGRGRQNASTTFYRWLKKNNYPEGFQVLCYNCNCGKRANKNICPHKKEIK